MGRRLRSNLPQLEGDLTPEWPDLEELRRRDEQLKQKQKQDFDRRHKTAPLPDIPEKTDVCMGHIRSTGVRASHECYQSR